MECVINNFRNTIYVKNFNIASGSESSPWANFLLLLSKNAAIAILATVVTAAQMYPAIIATFTCWLLYNYQFIWKKKLNWIWKIEELKLFILIQNNIKIILYSCSIFVTKKSTFCKEKCNRHWNYTIQFSMKNCSNWIPIKKFNLILKIYYFF